MIIKLNEFLQSEYTDVTIIQTYKYNTQKSPNLFSRHYFHFLSKVGPTLTSKTIDKFLYFMDHPLNLAFFPQHYVYAISSSCELT